MTLTIYHNPRCSKSRATLNLLKEHGHDPEIVDYVAAPPTADRLEEILLLLGIEARELLRTGEKVYKELELKDPSLTETALITAMVEHPILIERPIVVNGEKAAIGRPPEKVLDIL